MKRHWRIGVAAALVLLPAALAAQQPQAPARGRMMRGNAVARILDAKAELKLTADQTKTLESLRGELEKTNAPLLKKLEAARAKVGITPGTRPTEEQRVQLRQAMTELRPELEKMRENDRAAMGKALKVLTPEQQQWVREHMRGPRGRTGPGRS